MRTNKSGFDVKQERKGKYPSFQKTENASAVTYASLPQHFLYFLSVPSPEVRVG